MTSPPPPPLSLFPPQSPAKKKGGRRRWWLAKGRLRLEEAAFAGYFTFIVPFRGWRRRVPASPASFPPLPSPPLRRVYGAPAGLRGPPGRWEVVPMAQQAAARGTMPPRGEVNGWEVWMVQLGSQERQHVAVPCPRSTCHVALSLALSGCLRAPGQRFPAGSGRDFKSQRYLAAQPGTLTLPLRWSGRKMAAATAIPAPGGRESK